MNFNFKYLPETTKRSIKSSLSLLVLLTASLAVYSIMFTWPAYQENQRLEQTIREKSFQLKEQGELLPLYLKATRDMEALKVDHLNLSAARELPRKSIPTLSSIFSDLARKNHLLLGWSIPDLSILNSGQNLLKVNLSLKGKYKYLKRFIQQLRLLPYLRHIDQIRIDQTEKTGIKEFQLTIRIAVRKN